MLTAEDILESLPGGIIGVDTDLTVRLFNSSAEVLSEISRTTAIGRSLESLFPKDPNLVASLTSTVKTGRLQTDVEQSLSRRFSSAVPVSITTSTITDSTGEVTGAVVTIKDCSGIKAIEGSALRKDRLAYLGTFAANLAHEIKNPLGGLRGAAQLIIRKSTDAALTEYSELIVREADRLNAIVDSMLGFARPARLATEELNIHKLIDSTVKLLKRDNIQVTRLYDPSLPPVIGDQSALTQVMLNIIKNAIEATDEAEREGAVNIATKMVTDFHLHTTKEDESGHGGKMAAVIITDNGTGIKETEIEAVFTPFFTTKATGTGLGMPLSLKIIREHNGRIKIDSKEGAGTTVTLYLPTA